MDFYMCIQGALVGVINWRGGVISVMLTEVTLRTLQRCTAPCHSVRACYAGLTLARTGTDKRTGRLAIVRKIPTPPITWDSGGTQWEMQESPCKTKPCNFKKENWRVKTWTISPPIMQANQTQRDSGAAALQPKTFSI